MLRGRFLAALPLLALSLLVGTTSRGTSRDRVTLATATAVTAVISQIGVTKGAYKEGDLDVDIKRLPGGNDTIQALLGGAAHFAESSAAQFLAASARGLPLVVLGVHSYGYLGRLIAAKRNAGLKSLSDYKGKRIGIQVGTGAHTVFLMTLERQGFKPSDFVISNIRVADMPAAMMSDTFDAVLAWDPQAQRIIETGRGVEVIAPRQFEEMADIAYPFLLLTTSKMVRESPALVQKYVDGFVKAKHIVDTRRKDAISVYRSLLPPDAAATVSDADVEAALYSVIRYDRTVLTPRDIEELRRTADFLKQQGTLNAVPDLSKVLEPRFVEKSTSAR